jgi:hypothetical protein
MDSERVIPVVLISETENRGSGAVSPTKLTMETIKALDNDPRFGMVGLVIDPHLIADFGNITICSGLGIAIEIFKTSPDDTVFIDCTRGNKATMAHNAKALKRAGVPFVTKDGWGDTEFDDLPYLAPVLIAGHFTAVKVIGDHFNEIGKSFVGYEEGGYHAEVTSRNFPTKTHDNVVGMLAAAEFIYTVASNDDLFCDDAVHREFTMVDVLSHPNRDDVFQLLSEVELIGHRGLAPVSV